MIGTIKTHHTKIDTQFTRRERERIGPTIHMLPPLVGDVLHVITMDLEDT